MICKESKVESLTGTVMFPAGSAGHPGDYILLFAKLCRFISAYPS